MSNTLPKKKKKVPANTNVFTFDFKIKDLGDGRFERGEMRQTFSGQPLLMTDKDELTPFGYKILTACLADNIRQLAAMSASVGLNPMELMQDVGKRLRLIDNKPETMEAELSTPKIILQ